jgi:hypothetical protein
MGKPAPSGSSQRCYELYCDCQLISKKIQASFRFSLAIVIILGLDKKTVFSDAYASTTILPTTALAFSSSSVRSTSDNGRF